MRVGHDVRAGGQEGSIPTGSALKDPLKTVVDKVNQRCENHRFGLDVRVGWQEGSIPTVSARPHKAAVTQVTTPTLIPQS